MNLTQFPSLIIWACLTVVWTCQPQNSTTSQKVGPVTSNVVASETKPASSDASIPPSIPVATDTSRHYRFPWLSDYRSEDLLVNQIPVPEGFSRIPQTRHSFANWLRHLPLKPAGTAVHLFNGEQKSQQRVHARVVNIDTGKRDLQQCADAVMRLKAEYHFSRGTYEKIHFNYTSGDRVSFEDWRKGRKPQVRGNQVTFSEANQQIDNSYSNFKRYLRQIFNYAGTASLSKEMQQVDRKEMQIGDVFIQGGFPGHAVIVVDMAQNKAGEKVFMIAQSYMPAQDIHILKNWSDQALSPWYSLDFGPQLNSPEWTFSSDDLKRFAP